MGLDPDTSERIVLGSMMLSLDAAADVDEILTGSDYASPRHELIHGAVIALANAAAPTDAVAVSERLLADGDLTRVGGRAYVHQLCGEVVAPSAAVWHAKIVKEAALKRLVRAVGARLGQISESDGDALDVVNEARAELDATTLDTSDTDMSNEEALADAIASLDEDPGIPTPWPDLTRLLGGWKPQELVVVGARPAVGKSVFGMGAVMDAAYRGHRSVLLSQEMRARELWLRMLCAAGGIDGKRVQSRELRDEDRARLEAAAVTLRDQPLIVDDRFSVSVAQLQSKLRTLQRDGPIGLVVVDYLQLLKPANENDSRHVQVDKIARGLKETARMFNVPVVALAQLSRAATSRPDKTPQLTDLREAGGIEQAADSAILMHRDTDAETGDPSVLKLFVAKNRHGPTAALTLQFEGPHYRITEPGSRYAAPMTEPRAMRVIGGGRQ